MRGDSPAYVQVHVPAASVRLVTRPRMSYLTYFAYIPRVFSDAEEEAPYERPAAGAEAGLPDEAQDRPPALSQTARTPFMAWSSGAG